MSWFVVVCLRRRFRFGVPRRLGRRRMCLGGGGRVRIGGVPVSRGGEGVEGAVVVVVARVGGLRRVVRLSRRAVHRLGDRR